MRLKLSRMSLKEISEMNMQALWSAWEALRVWKQLYSSMISLRFKKISLGSTRFSCSWKKSRSVETKSRPSLIWHLMEWQPRDNRHRKLLQQALALTNLVSSMATGSWMRTWSTQWPSNSRSTLMSSLMTCPESSLKDKFCLSITRSKGNFLSSKMMSFGNCLKN